MLQDITATVHNPSAMIMTNTNGLTGMARIFLSVKAFCEFFCGEEIDNRVPSIYFDLESRLKGEIDLVKMGWMK